MNKPSPHLFKRRSFIILLLLGGLAVCYKILHLKDHALAVFGNLFFIWIPLAACLVVGTRSLIRYPKNKDLNEVIISLLPVLFIFIIILLGFFEVPGRH